jgi:plastocyanin
VTTPPVAPATATVEASATANVFTPTTTTVKPGGVVTWTFGARRHNVAFVASPGAPENIPNLLNDQASRTFTTPGTYAYVCTLHAGMVGTVIVK